MPKEKGQVLTYDLFFALTVFVLLAGVMLLVWYYNAEYAQQEETHNDMKERVTRLADIMVNTRGSPGRWQENPSLDINAIGLVRERRVIEKEKLEAFESMDYSKARNAMKLWSYDFYFKLEQDGKIITEKKSGVATNDISQADYIVGTKRIVEYEGEKAVLSILLYK